MFDFLEGELIEKRNGVAVVRCGGIGFAVFVPKRSLDALEAGSKVRFYTKVIFPQEGTPSIYGFESLEERELFELLLKIPKVGSKVALSVLSAFSPERFREVISSEDVDSLSAVPGLGKKLSKRVIVELKGKIAEIEMERISDVVEALVQLGYTRQEILSVADKLPKDDPQAAIKEAVRLLSRGKV